MQDQLSDSYRQLSASQLEIQRLSFHEKLGNNDEDNRGAYPLLDEPIVEMSSDCPVSEEYVMYMYIYTNMYIYTCTYKLYVVLSEFYTVGGRGCPGISQPEISQTTKSSFEIRTDRWVTKVSTATVHVHIC